MGKLDLILSSKQFEDILIKCLRVSIAIIFIWFGSLKIFGHNPVQDLVAFSMFPSLCFGNGLMMLGVAEVVIGVLILANSFLACTYSLLLLHLLGTFSTFIYGWKVVFVPHFLLKTNFVVLVYIYVNVEI